RSGSVTVANSTQLIPHLSLISPQESQPSVLFVAVLRLNSLLSTFFSFRNFMFSNVNVQDVWNEYWQKQLNLTGSPFNSLVIRPETAEGPSGSSRSSNSKPEAGSFAAQSYPDCEYGHAQNVRTLNLLRIGMEELESDFEVTSRRFLFEMKL
ncbi:hypothetical protein OSTOST_09238, partial [Ostertagia ostertagi]